MIIKYRNRALILAFVLSVFNFQIILSQQLSNRSPEEARMVLAYSFYLKQKISLDFISFRYPNLQENIALATSEWDREFKSSIDHIDTLLGNKLKDKWEKEKKALEHKFSGADNSRVKEADAKNFIFTVCERASGKIQSPILETYLAYNPVYQKTPDAEFSEGYTKKISSREIRPSYPLNIRISFPKSWKETVLKKGDQFLKCTSNYGIGQVSMDVSVDQLQTAYPKGVVEKLLSKESLQKETPAKCTQIDYADGLFMYNCPTASVTFLQKPVKVNEGPYLITEKYFSYYKNFRIKISFTINGISHADVETCLKRNKKLFVKLIENVVILSQWGL